MSADASETIWHITTDGTPAKPGAEPFVHASFTSQVAGSLDKHYAEALSVELLRLDPDALGESLVIEPSRGGALFPHVYAEIPDAAIVERRTFTRDSTAQPFDLSGLG